MLPPLGEVPQSGKGGVVGIFELLPFNKRHPLSQPLRAASSPIGEPRNHLRLLLRLPRLAVWTRRAPVARMARTITTISRPKMPLPVEPPP